MEEKDYCRDLSIDINNLHKEFLRQSQLFMEYAEECALARRRMDKLKEGLDVLRAEKDSAIRLLWLTKGVKYTEAQVSSHILLDKECKEASCCYLESKYEYEMISSAVKAFEQKKSALENLVRLHGQQYFSCPEVHDEDWNKQTKDITKERIRTRMNKGDE